MEKTPPQTTSTDAQNSEETENNSEEPMEQTTPLSEPEPGPSTSGENLPSTSGAVSQSPTAPKKEISPSTLGSPATIPNDDIQPLFTEMDALNRLVKFFGNIITNKDDFVKISFGFLYSTHKLYNTRTRDSSNIMPVLQLLAIFR